MLPVFVVKVAEIAIGLAVGSLAHDAVNKGEEAIKKVIKDKKKEKES